jgi:hypothetical protein
VVWTSDAAVVWDNLAHDVSVAAPAGSTAPPPRVIGEPPGADDEVADPGAAAPQTPPVPLGTKSAGREPFTGADVTATCG